MPYFPYSNAKAHLSPENSKGKEKASVKRKSVDIEKKYSEILENLKSPQKEKDVSKSQVRTPSQPRNLYEDLLDTCKSKFDELNLLSSDSSENDKNAKSAYTGNPKQNQEFNCSSIFYN